MMRSLILAALLALAACTPAQQCRYDATHALREVERQIAESREAIDKGYRWVEIRRPLHYGLTLCAGPATSRHCDPADGPYHRIERVNVAAERARLAALESRAARLRPQAEAALAACPQP